MTTQNGDRDKRIAEQLDKVVGARNSQDAVVWTVFGIFWATSAILFGGIFEAEQIQANNGIGLIISSVGIITSIGALLLVHRGRQFINFYNHILQELEETEDIPTQFRLSGRRNPNGDRFLAQGIRVGAGGLMHVLLFSSVIGWGFLLLFFFCRAS